MRRRRAERCVARAEAALERGDETDARDALDEARALDPQTPDFDSLKTRVDERQAAVAAAARRRKRLTATAAAIAALVVAAGTVSLLDPGSANSRVPVASAEPPQQATTPANVPVATSSEAIEAAAPRDVAAAEWTPPRSEPVPLDPPAGGKIPIPRDETPPPSSSPVVTKPPLPVGRDVEPRRLEPRMTTSDAIGSLSLPAATVDPKAGGLPATAVPAPHVPPPPPVVEPAPPARPDVSEEQKVRIVLEAFEAAYSSLNAAAARAVWPTVDEPALARAFASLRSQRVSLGLCSIRITARTARADCTGTTAWTPRIGGGERTEPRRWAFELALQSGTWTIVAARATGR